MDVAYVSALSALAGSVIGGLTSGVTTWLNQRSQTRAGYISHELARREDLVRDFILSASKTYGDAIVNDQPQMQELVNLYAMVSRMRVLSMPRSVASAIARKLMTRLSAKPFRIKGNQMTSVASADGTAGFTGDCAQAMAIDAKKTSPTQTPCCQPRNDDRRASISRDLSIRKGDGVIGHTPAARACAPARASLQTAG